MSLGHGVLLGVAFVRFAAENPSHFRVMYSASVAGEEFATQYGDSKAQMETMVSDAQAAGLVSSSYSARDIVLAAMALTYGLARMVADGHPHIAPMNPEEVTEMAMTMTGILGEGLDPRDGVEPDTESS